VRLLALVPLGSWAQLITIFTVLVVAFVIWRGGGGTALSTLTEANRVLEKRVHELGAEVRDLKVENAELKGRTDVTMALAPMLEWSVKHEERAQERHEKTMVILGLIAKGLGQEPNGDGNGH
jgi:hypothetical protein